MLNDEAKIHITHILAEMQDEIGLVFFTQEFECLSCSYARTFVEEIAALNRKIKVKKYDFVLDKFKTDDYAVDKIPAIILLDKDGRDTGIKFYGIPGGYEINSFLESILAVSGRKAPLPPEISARIAAINKDVHIQVFISLGCPYCPTTVGLVNRLALENQRIHANTIDTDVFTYLAIKYSVSAVPKVVINETHELIGVQPITAYLDVIEKL
jgi:glutaredoxin-like protein